MTDIQIKRMEERMIRIIIGSRKIDPAAVTADTTFEQLGISSLDALAIAFDLEAEFGIMVPDSELDKLRTVRDVFTGVQRLLGEQKRTVNP